MDRGRFERRDRLIQERREDPYRERRKKEGPLTCGQCGAVFVDGRWDWAEPPEDAADTLCPACRRIRDRYPAGEVLITGDFFTRNQAEIKNLIKNEAEREKGEHPLERVMETREIDKGLLVTTTGIHLARRIGESLNKAYQGSIEFSYGDGEKSIVVKWSR